MNHIYCTDCGTKMTYAHSKPNFCSKCGSGTGAIAKKVANATNTLITEDLLEDETSIDEVPMLDGLSVDVEHYDDNIFTFGSLAGKEPKSKRVRNRGSRRLEDFIDDRKG